MVGAVGVIRDSGQAQRGVVPPEAPRPASGGGLGAAPPSNRFAGPWQVVHRVDARFFASETFPLRLFRRSFLSPTGKLLFVGAPGASGCDRGRLHADLFEVVEEERARSNLVIGVFAPREGYERAPFQSVQVGLRLVVSYFLRVSLLFVALGSLS